MYKSSSLVCALAKSLALTLLLFIGVFYNSSAQQVMKVNGNPCIGSTITYALTSVSCSSVSWYANGGTILSQSSNSVDVRWDSPTSNAWVEATYSSCSFGNPGTRTSPAISITGSVTPSVNITANQNNVCSPTTITFTATPVNGGPNPYYFWQVNGTTVSSGNPNTFSRANFSNGDIVSVLMSSAHPCATPTSATSNSITVSITPFAVPSVSIASSSMPFCQGVGTFSAAPYNEGSNPTYTWYKNGSPVTDNISSTPKYLYQPSFSLASGDRIKYSITSNLACVSPSTVESNEIVVSTTSQITPTISISPSVMSFCQETNVTFTASGGSGYTLSNYQWRLNGSAVGTINSPTYTTNQFNQGSVITVTAATSGSCISSSSASGTTSGIPITVIPKVMPVVSIAVSPSAIICAGANATFTASPVNGGTPAYDWQINGVTVSSGASATFSRSNLNSGDVVSVIMTSTAQCKTATTATSNGIVMTVNHRPVTSVSIASSSMPFCQGVGTFSAAPNNEGPNPTYTWYKNGSPVTDNISSTPKYLYQPSFSLISGDRIKYSITSSLVCASPSTVESNEIVVSTTSQITPTISVSPSLLSICQGDNMTFTASGGSGYTLSDYQWRLNGSAVGTVNSGTYTTNQFNQGSVVTVTASVNGSCVATSSASGSTSGTPITVAPKPVATLNHTGSKTICSTDNLLLITPTVPEYAYQWRKNSDNILNATNPSYAATSTGIYDIVVTRNGCNTVSSSLDLSVNARPVANAGPDITLYKPDDAIVLHGSGSDSDGTITGYIWTKTSGPVINSTPTNLSDLSLSGLGEGTYVFTLKVVDNFETGCQSINDHVTVKVIILNNYNWVKETSVLVSDKKNVSQVDPLAIGEKNISWSYFDGLGRQMQNIQVQGSPAFKDIVQPIKYDVYGRESTKYLPYVAAGSDGWFKDDALQDPNTSVIDEVLKYRSGKQYTFYQAGNQVATDQFPYAITVFEPSPLNRIHEQGASGADWQPSNDLLSIEDKTIKKRYESNGANEVCLFVYNASTGLISLDTEDAGRYHAPNQLYRNKTLDEHNNESIEYVDKEGKTICKSVQYEVAEGVKRYASTYYIYDDFGNLVVVLPPVAVEKLLLPQH
jgi:hypothetical protein